MRILSVCDDLGRGGIQRVLQNFSLSYRKAGHDVAVLARVDGGPRHSRLEAAGIEVFVPDRGLKLLEAADQFRPDLIHIHRAGTASPADVQTLTRLRRADRRVIETNVFARADLSEGADLIDVHMQLSTWCMWRWRRRLGPQRHRQVGVVVPNPVAVEDFDRARPEVIASFRERCHIPPEAYVCGRVGQPSESKWHRENVLAFAPIATRDPRAYLLLLGFPASLQPVLDSLREDIRRRVIVLPLTDSDQDLSTFYSSLDCFLHVAQIGETFGLVLTEAMLCGVPVVTASLPYKDNSQVEVVGHLRGGMVAGSVKRVGPAALMMWENDQLREQLGRQARRSVIDRYASDAVAAMALGVGQLALESSDREDLARRIAQQPELRTDVCEEEIARLLADTVGGPDPLDLLKMRLVHNFVVQRGIQRYLDWRYPRH